MSENENPSETEMDTEGNHHGLQFASENTTDADGAPSAPTAGNEDTEGNQVKIMYE